MDVYSHRRQRLSLLVDQFGGPTKFADKVGRSQSQISQLLGAKRMGAAIARDIEIKCRLKPGTLDMPPGLDMMVREESTEYKTEIKEAADIIDVYQQLNDKEKKKLLAIARLFIEMEDH